LGTKHLDNEKNYFSWVLVGDIIPNAPTIFIL